MEARRTNGYWKYPDRSKPKPEPEAVKECAAAGLSRAEAAEKLGIKYKNLTYLLTTYNKYAVAWKDGTREYKEKQNASSQKA